MRPGAYGKRRIGSPAMPRTWYPQGAPLQVLAAFLAFFFQIGYRALDDLTIYIGFIEIGEGGTWWEALLHPAYARNSLRDGGTDVEQEQYDSESSPHTQANQQSYNPANNMVDDAFIDDSCQHRYVKETYKHLQ